MSSILESLMSQLGGDTMTRIGSAIGADGRATESAVSAALPMLLSGLARNAQTADGAGSLLGALDRDHDGSVLDDLGGFLGSFEQGPGDGILGHVFGGRRAAVESGLSRTTGLDTGAVSKLLVMLAPLVMGALGRAKRSQALDGGALSSMLRQESERATAARPELSGMLGQLLDSDGDGQVIDDVAKIGGGLLGALFGRKKR